VTAMAQFYCPPPCPACDEPTDYSIDGESIIPTLCDECARSLDFTDPRVVAAREARGLPRRRTRPKRLPAECLWVDEAEVA
jgi:hypothetical protein